MIAGNNMCVYKTIPIGMKQVIKGMKQVVAGIKRLVGV
jgi:hypothetical protein